MDSSFPAKSIAPICSNRVEVSISLSPFTLILSTCVRIHSMFLIKARCYQHTKSSKIVLRYHIGMNWYCSAFIRTPFKRTQYVTSMANMRFDFSRYWAMCGIGRIIIIGYCSYFWMFFFERNYQQKMKK